MSTATLSVYQDSNYLWCTITNTNSQMVYCDASGGTSTIINPIFENEKFTLRKGSMGVTLFNSYIAFSSSYIPMNYCFYYFQTGPINAITTSGIILYSNRPSGGSPYFVNISNDSNNPTILTLTDSLSSTYNITIEDNGYLKNVLFVNSEQTISNFPYRATVNSNDTWLIKGETVPSYYTITAQNTQNMKQIQVGSAIYNNFPASIRINNNDTLQCSGEDDKTIIVNYTNTSVPVITDT